MVRAGPPSTPFAGISTVRRGCRACARHDVMATAVPPAHYFNAYAAQAGHPRLAVLDAAKAWMAGIGSFAASSLLADIAFSAAAVQDGPVSVSGAVSVSSAAGAPSSPCFAPRQPASAPDRPGCRRQRRVSSCGAPSPPVQVRGVESVPPRRHLLLPSPGNGRAGRSRAAYPVKKTYGLRLT